MHGGFLHAQCGRGVGAKMFVMLKLIFLLFAGDSVSVQKPSPAPSQLYGYVHTFATQ